MDSGGKVPPSLHHQSPCSPCVSLLSISAGSWPGPGGNTDLAVGSKRMNHGFTFPPSRITKVRVGSSAFGRAFSGTTFPNSTKPCLHQGCFSFDLKHTSFHVMPQNKKSFRERLRCWPCHYTHFGKCSGAFSLRRLVT